MVALMPGNSAKGTGWRCQGEQLTAPLTRLLEKEAVLCVYKSSMSHRCEVLVIVNQTEEESQPPHIHWPTGFSAGQRS